MHPIFLAVIGAIFILALVIVKLLLYGRNKSYLNFLLAVAITGFVWYAMIYLLTNSGQLVHYPFLFNKGLPLYYAIGPCLYIYIRGSLDHAYSGFRRVDLLHLLLLIPALISIFPFNLLGDAEQREIVNRVVSNLHYAFSDEKYIVEPYHWLTFPASASIYTFLQFRIAYLASKRTPKNSNTINWVYFFSGISGIIFLGMLAVNITIMRNEKDAIYILHNSKAVIFLCLCLLALSVMFFVNPELIYGLSKNYLADRLEKESATDVVQITSFNQIISPAILPEKEKLKLKAINGNLVQRVETFMHSEHGFRRAGLTLSELASQLDVPNHKLSELFNNHYQLNFNTYINNLRIDYVKKRLDAGDWKQLTLEAIALESGFSSRNTFFVAFKKVTGNTPSFYLGALKEI